MSSAVAPFLQLPNDALLEVFARSNPLPPRTIARTCRHFFSLLQNDAAWGVLHQRDFRTLEKAEGKTTFLASYQTLHRIFSNIFHGIYLNDLVSNETRPQPRDLDYPYLTIAQDKLFRGGNGHFVEVWDLRTDENQTLRLHGDDLPLSVWHVLPHQGDLVADVADSDKVVVYDLKAPSLREFVGPKQCNVMILHEGKLIGGLVNGSIEIWDLKTGKVEKELTGHRHSVNVLTMVDEFLISGDLGNVFKVWDWKKKDCLFDFEVSVLWRVDNYCAFNHRFILGLHHGEIHVMKVNVAKRKMETVFVIREQTVLLSLVTGAIGGIPMLLAADDDHSVQFWDLDSGERLKLYSMDDETPRSIAFYDGKLICSNHDGTISRYNFAADDLAILEDIAQEFEQGDQKSADHRFSKMPRYVKMKIAEMEGCRSLFEDTLYDYSDHKAEAIRNYVLFRRAEEEKKEKV